MAVRQLARPAAAPGRPDQLAEVAKLQHHLAAQASFVDDITRGSSVQRAQTRPSHGAPSPVLHVTMPVASTEEAAYKRAGSIRMPRRVERRPVPKMLQGSELESAVLPEKQILPPTIVTACRQVETLGVKVHLKLPALQQLAYTGHPTDSTRTAIQPLRDGAQASPLQGREHQLHAQYLADKLGLSLPSAATTAAPIIAVDYPSVAPRRTISATTSGLSMATATRAAYRDQHNPGASIVAGQQTSPNEPPAVRRDQESHGMPLSGPSAAPLVQQQPGPSEVPASRRFGGTAFKPSATTIRRRVREVEGPRTLQRSLTEGLWDTSQGALKKLLAHRTHQNVEQTEAGEMLRAEESWAEQGGQGQGERALDSVVFGPSEPSSAPSTDAQQEVQPSPVLIPMSAVSDLSTQQQHQQQVEQDQACLTNTLDACSPTLTVPVTAPGHSPDSLLQAPLSLRTVSPGNASVASVQWAPGDVLDQPAMAGSSGATGGPVLAKRASLKTTPTLSPSAQPPTTAAPPFPVPLPYQAPTIAIPPPWPWPDQQPYAPSPTTSPAPDAQPLSRLDAVALAHLPDTLDYLTPSLSRNGVLLEHAEQVVGSRAAPPSPGVEAALAVVMHQRLAAQRRWSATWGDVAGSRQGSPSSPRLRTQDPLACSPAGSARGSPDGRRSPGSPSPRRRGPGSPLSRLGSPDLVAPRSMQCGPDPGRPGSGFIPEGILLALAAQEAKSVARARSPSLVATGQPSGQGLTTVKAAPAGLKRSRQRPHTQSGQAEAAALVQHLESHAVTETSLVDFIDTLHHSNRSLTAGGPLPQPGPGSGFGQQSAVPRDLWVRDALHDPSNASNPAMAGLLTDAVRQQLPGPWARQVEITMDSPNTGLPPAAMRDAPGQQVDAGEAQLVARAEAAAEMIRKGPVPQSQSLAPCALPRTQPLAQGMLERAPTLLSSSARAPGEASAALALSMPRSATELVLTNMTVYSTSRVLRNRLRLKEAKLQARPVGRGASIADDGSSCPVSQTQSQASLSATDSMPLMIPEVKGPRSLPQPRLAVHSDKLLQSDVAYITMCAPPRPKHSIPSTVHARPEHVVQTSGTAQLPKAPVPGSHVAAMMAEVTEQMASLAPAADPPTHYTPTFLRPTRKSIVPSVQHVKSEKQQWVVPPFSSKNGYAHGCYDADSELLYFT
ncbi:hypothetical protein QJQ45_000818 [Haematococcus lacustris]|nr:hypothetical protein QJQ45_000818 [Haematococcus lacustris]